MVEGPCLTPKNPSTARRAVPLPTKSRGGFKVAAVTSSAAERPLQNREAKLAAAEGPHLLVDGELDLQRKGRKLPRCLALNTIQPASSEYVRHQQLLRIAGIAAVSRVLNYPAAEAHEVKAL
jgi:ribosome-associated protein YbcJ (S4-like RNA binding protein)